MIRAFPTIVTVALLGACQSSAPHAGRPDAQEQEIRDLLNRWESAFERRDVAGVMSIYRSDANLLVYDFGPRQEQHGAEALDHARQHRDEGGEAGDRSDLLLGHLG